MTESTMQVHERCGAVLGPDRVDLDGDTPQASPRTEAEAGAILRVASEEKWLVLPRGAGLEPTATTASGADGQGRVVPQPDLVLSSSSMADLVDHEPGDLTACVGAGMRLGALQHAVWRERQWLAVDPPGGPDVTLGGVASTGLAGPLRAQFGRPRDHVLGLTLVDGRGRVLSLGGRVVKNVAGFDLVRLTAGGRGALGLVTELNLRLHPVPEADRTLIWRCETLAKGWALGRRIASLLLPLTAAELLTGSWPAPIDGGYPRVLVRLMGSEGAVRQMSQRLVDEAGLPDIELEDRSSSAAAAAIAAADGAAPVSFRLHSLPSQGREFLAAFEAMPLERLALHLLGGTFRGSLQVGSNSSALAHLQSLLEPGEGTLRVGRLVEPSPRESADGSEPPPFGVTTGRADPPPASSKARVRASVLRAFDPAGILPGSWREKWFEPLEGER